MAEGPFGEPRLTAIGPFTNERVAKKREVHSPKRTVVEFTGAKTGMSPEEVRDVQDEMEEAIKEASYLTPPEMDLFIEQQDFANVATVEIYKEFITIEQFDAIREIAENSLGTKGGQIKGSQS